MEESIKEIIKETIASGQRVDIRYFKAGERELLKIKIAPEPHPQRAWGNVVLNPEDWKRGKE